MDLNFLDDEDISFFDLSSQDDSRADSIHHFCFNNILEKQATELETRISSSNQKRSSISEENTVVLSNPIEQDGLDSFFEMDIIINDCSSTSNLNQQIQHTSPEQLHVTPKQFDEIDTTADFSCGISDEAIYSLLSLTGFGEDTSLDVFKTKENSPSMKEAGLSSKNTISFAGKSIGTAPKGNKVKCESKSYKNPSAKNSRLTKQLSAGILRDWKYSDLMKLPDLNTLRTPNNIKTPEDIPEEFVDPAYKYVLSKTSGKSLYEPSIVRCLQGLPDRNEEALCPYCPECVFYRKKDSSYLHHLNLIHGVFSNGSLMPLPRTAKRVVIKKSSLKPETQLGLICPYKNCKEKFIRSRNFEDSGHKEDKRYRVYFRHCNEKHNMGKKLFNNEEDLDDDHDIRHNDTQTGN